MWIETGTLFVAQSIDGEFKRYEYLCYYLAFKSILDKTEGFRLYHDELAEKVHKLGWHITSWKRLQGLVHRMEQQGFLEQAPIKVHENYWIGDGNHRLCCAMALDIDQVPIIIKLGSFRKRYRDRSWFAENFDKSFMELLDYTREGLFSKYAIQD